MRGAGLRVRARPDSCLGMKRGSPRRLRQRVVSSGWQRHNQSVKALLVFPIKGKSDRGTPLLVQGSLTDSHAAVLARGSCAHFSLALIKSGSLFVLDTKMTIPGYNVRKAAQVTAFFAQKEGGSIDVLKLAKLLYLADREFLSRYDFPILFDYFVSMPHGPVTSMTLNYINGLEEYQNHWSDFVESRARNQVGVARRHISVEDLDELSDAEIHVMEATWDKFGHMSSWEIRDWTHRNCPEWEDPHGSSYPIPYERVLKFLHKENSADIAAEIEIQRSLDQSIERAR
jgi:uncharacterized phage-associated protein